MTLSPIAAAEALPPFISNGEPTQIIRSSVNRVWTSRMPRPWTNLGRPEDWSTERCSANSHSNGAPIVTQLVYHGMLLVACGAERPSSERAW